MTLCSRRGLNSLLQICVDNNMFISIAFKNQFIQMFKRKLRKLMVVDIKRLKDIKYSNIIKLILYNLKQIFVKNINFMILILLGVNKLLDLKSFRYGYNFIHSVLIKSSQLDY